ncbi:MAG: nascent polypeptide-associated complex protein [Candidatus Bathyarchaeia archaeon]
MAHRVLRSMRGIPSREALRMMQRMGMETKPLDGVRDVTITTGDKRIIIEEPTVMSIMVQGQRIFQVAGGNLREENIRLEAKPGIPEGDVELVARQTNVSLDEARRALEDSGGDLAEAILSIKRRAPSTSP